MKGRVISAGIAAMAMTLVVATTAQATAVVVPNAEAASEGAYNNRLPFFVDGGMRYQQVYNSSQFSAFSGAESISQISFRCDSTFCDSFSVTLSSIDIRLSTTSAASGGLSTTFANNVGADETLVYSGSLTLSSAGQTGTPNPFDIVITLQTGFLYDPSAGNLLLDITNSSPEDNVFDPAIALDAVFGNNGVSSRVFGAEGDPGDTIGTTSLRALVTQFTSTPQVPEPSALALFSLGVAGLGFARRKRAT